ncbi:MAG: hypothetical protein MZV64_19420 [Ignavibacteriales bacterium]|nr:hypothetical protein [Ignavibacteriales bacterium]
MEKARRRHQLFPLRQPVSRHGHLPAQNGRASPRAPLEPASAPHRLSLRCGIHPPGAFDNVPLRRHDPLPDGRLCHDISRWSVGEIRPARLHPRVPAPLWEHARASAWIQRGGEEGPAVPE